MRRRPPWKPPRCGLKLDRDNARYYGKRGSPKPNVYFVEGEWLTYDQIAERMQRSPRTAQKYYTELMKEHGRVTWAMLKKQKTTPAAPDAVAREGACGSVARRRAPISAGNNRG